MRLDKYLVDEGYFESRNRALEAIKAGEVKLNGKKAKPSMQITTKSIVEVEKKKFYVSRAGRKLEHFLAHYSLDFKDKNVLDIGSSTGGFSQIILEQGASRITCVDVGTDQLHTLLREDKRVAIFENSDIRDFQSEEVFELITCDVSFISILQITEAINRLVTIDTSIVILYKPQFEVGKECKRDSKGVVIDKDRIARKKEGFEEEMKQLGWKESYQVESGITGKNGNQEYFYHFIKMK